MILGIGTDIIEIARIRKAIQKEIFCNKLFSEKERAYCFAHKDPAPHFAARFAGKESIAKALGVGFGEELAWKDIEILNLPSGQPQATVNNHKFHQPTLILSVTHCKEYAMSTAIWLSKTTSFNNIP